jgi:hypothetical protein
MRLISDIKFLTGRDVVMHWCSPREKMKFEPVSTLFYVCFFVASAGAYPILEVAENMRVLF